MYESIIPSADAIPVHWLWFEVHPIFTITALEESTGRLLAITKAVAPTSTEMACRNGHEGGWARNNVSGLEPDCKSCYTNFHIFEDGFSGTAFNMWVPGFDALYRSRTDNHGVMYSACHGSTHAVYGEYNIYGLQRDNQQPIQYQGLAGTIGTHKMCMVCHKIPMSDNGHHRNMVYRDPVPSLVEKV